MTHTLKVWPEFFDKLASGEKPFEIRRDDRGYMVGDVLALREFEPVANVFTGRALWMRVTYITNWEQKTGFVVMGIKPTTQP